MCTFKVRRLSIHTYVYVLVYVKNIYTHTYSLYIYIHIIYTYIHTCIHIYIYMWSLDPQQLIKHSQQTKLAGQHRFLLGELRVELYIHLSWQQLAKWSHGAIPRWSKIFDHFYIKTNSFGGGKNPPFRQNIYIYICVQWIHSMILCRELHDLIKIPFPINSVVPVVP